ncbi:MAG: hypothetical protein KY445_04880, partial [Armatimonadetes bacterium]|nr:hypothetical protein [Armatimonadota bacterium]
MPTRHYALGDTYTNPDGTGKFYEEDEIVRLHRIVSEQIPGALDVLGAGVAPNAGNTRFAVTAGTGLSVNIAAGLAVARHATLGSSVLETRAVIARSVPASATRFLFATIDTAPANDSRETRLPAFVLSEFETLDGGVLLAQIVTGATTVTSVTDRRTFLSLGGGGAPADANQLANTVKAGPASGAAAAPTYRALTGADLPTATTTEKGATLFAADGNATAGRAVEATDARLSNARTPTAHTHPATEISDATATGRAVVTALDAAVARAAIEAASATELTNATTPLLRKDGTTPLTAAWNVGGQKLTNAATPTEAGDVVTKAYADALASGFKAKQSVVAATTANIGSLSGLFTLDGVALQAGNRVLVKDQTTTSENGIYIASAAAWTRAADADESTELAAGTAVYVAFGTAFGKSNWALLVDTP